MWRRSTTSPPSIKQNCQGKPQRLGLKSSKVSAYVAVFAETVDSAGLIIPLVVFTRMTVVSVFVPFVLKWRRTSVEKTTLRLLQHRCQTEKHKARAPVACRQLTDGNEAAAPQDRSPLPLLTVTGTVSLANLDPRVTPSLQASNQKHTDIYNKQEQEKVETKGERSMNTTAVHEHTESTQSYVWEQPRIKAHNCNERGRRTRSLHIAGIFPQAQICRERFCGTPFRLQ